MGFHHVMHEAFGNLQTVQAYNMQDEERRRFAAATDQMREFGVRMEVLNGLTRPITELLGLGMVGITIVVGAYLVIYQVTEVAGIRLADRPLSISQILVFFGLLVGASDPVRKMSTVLSGINTGIVAADMLFPLLDRSAPIRDPAEPVKPPRPHQQIEFRNVTFGYREGHLVLHNLRLAIPHGQHVAIVGPNGSGKSSLINLLCRFYDPTAGSIHMDGVDLRQMSLFDLRSRIGLVTQQTELMNESVEYNIRYGTLAATEAQIARAAELAHAADFIERRLPERYHTRVGQHGHRLSGGQRQRIALARAILRNPDILILDEATSQIDGESEELILQTLRQFGQGRTLILITHRAKLLELADVIWRFEEGVVTVERATASAA
jgi:ATP-binding cassette subfamily B protein/subfamily B ATP-binding cassette protein MsbA